MKNNAPDGCRGRCVNYFFPNHRLTHAGLPVNFVPARARSSTRMT